MFMRNPTYLPDRSFGNQAFGIASIAAENARFMSRVYGWMTGGLCLTGVVAWNVGGNPQLVQAGLGNRLLFWGLIIAQPGSRLSALRPHQPDQRSDRDAHLFSIRWINRTHAIQHLSGLHGI
jgi:FtsH-binding integral membrane protein